MLITGMFLQSRPMLRTWAALFGASIAAFWIYSPLGYLAIDLIAASLVVARPSGLAQKAIGALFVCMVLFDLVFYLSPQADVELFRATLTGISWVQWLILGTWIGHDTWRRYHNWSNATGSIPYSGQRRV